MTRPGKYIGNGPITDFKIIFDDAPNIYFSNGTLNPISRPFSGSSAAYTYSAKRSALPGSSLPFDIVEISNVSPYASNQGSFLRFSIEQAKFNSEPSNIPSNVAPKLALRTRGSEIYFVGKKPQSVLVNANPWQQLGGIGISSRGEQNDVILPYGIGSRDYADDTVTDRGIVYVNSGGGIDAVIGGYGQDYFGARNPDQSITLKDIKQSLNSVASGSKFFVGGSLEDVLDGSSNSDFLVGDRFNGYELYLPTDALKDMPSLWKTQAEALRKYQDPGYTDTTGAGHELLANWQGRGPGSSQYPLWIPGNDIIRSYESDDVVYGDDNTLDSNLKQLVVLRSRLSETPDWIVKAGGVDSQLWNKAGFKLAADFIDAGPGDDQIFAGVGADAIIGGTGSDLINAGSQVIATGYQPFFGPKVFYGNNAIFDPVTGVWQKEAASIAPDIFVIGHLSIDENDLNSSDSGQIDALAQDSRTVAEKLAGFEKAWKTAGGVVKAIPKVGGIVSGMVNAVTSLLKLQDPKPTTQGRPAKAIDAMTIIKDFDATDILSMNLLPGQATDYERGSFNLAVSDKDNPLIGDMSISKGARIMLADNAGTYYTRVFMQDVEDLYFLGATPSSDGSYLTVTLGGSAFGEVVNELTGRPLYEQVRFS